MASASVNLLLQCCSCEQQLSLACHTLACLHNICKNCMKESTLTKGQNSNTGKCPKCGKIFNTEELKLLPFLSTYIKQNSHLECHLCLEENVKSTGRYWCDECKQLFCSNCNKVHMKLLKAHNCKELDKVSRSEWTKWLTNETCFLHGKERDLFCDQCNMCFCDVCYKEECHSCLDCAHGLNVKYAVLRQKTVEGPVLEREVKEFEKSVKKLSENLVVRSGELNAELDRKCLAIWQNYEDEVERAWRDADELCNKLRREKYDEERRLQDRLAENASLLSQIEIWLLSCQHLLHEAERNVDILCGLQTLRSRVQSWCKEWNQLEKKQTDLAPDFSNSSSIITDFSRLYTKNDGLSWILDKFPKLKKLEKLEEWNLHGSNSRIICSIHVDGIDGHVFLCDLDNGSLIELDEFGKFVNEFWFTDQNALNFFQPRDMCSISTDILVVCGMGLIGRKLVGKVYFLNRIKVPPFFQIQTIIKKKTIMSSLCQKNGTVFVCDLDFKIYSIKNGKEMKTIKIDAMQESRSPLRIRVDPLSGIFWGSRDSSSEMISFNSEGEKLSLVKIEEKDFLDFYLNELGHFYFSTSEGIFSFLLGKKNSLLKFDKNSEIKPRIFATEDKIFVFVENDSKYLIKIFKIVY